MDNRYVINLIKECLIHFQLSKYNKIIRDPEIYEGVSIVRGAMVLVLDILDWIKEKKSFKKSLKINTESLEMI